MGTFPVYATTVGPAVPYGTGRAKVGTRGCSPLVLATMHGLASIRHNHPYGFHSAGTPSEVPSERLGGRDRKWVAVVHETAAPSHVALMPRLGIEPLACEGRVVVGHSCRTISCSSTRPLLA